MSVNMPMVTLASLEHKQERLSPDSQEKLREYALLKQYCHKSFSLNYRNFGRKRQTLESVGVSENDRACKNHPIIRLMWDSGLEIQQIRKKSRRIYRIQIALRKQASNVDVVSVSGTFDRWWLYPDRTNH